MSKNIKPGLQRNAILLKTLKGIAVSIILYFLFVGIIAALILNEKISEKVIPQAVAAFAFLGVFIGALVAAGAGKNRRPAAALLTALTVAIIKLLVCAGTEECELFSTRNIMIYTGIVLGGLLAAVIGTKKGRKK